MPQYLAPDEVIIANDAFALATTGRTRDGTFLPLYVHVALSDSWFMPMVYYGMAAALQVLPLAEWSIRVPTVTLALVSIAMSFVVAGKLLRDQSAAIAAFVVLACAPAFFILSRYALDYIYPVPFILGWLWCLLTAVSSDNPRKWFFGAGLCLGLGWYSYISAILLMPIYLLLTLIAVPLARRYLAWLVTGFAVPLIFFVVWVAQHPDALTDTLVRYGFLKEVVSTGQVVSGEPFDIVAMAGRYLNFFNPDFLFEYGDTYLPFSTRSTGVFVPVAAVLMLAGVFAALVSYRQPLTVLIVAGFAVSPLAASILQDEGAIRRATGMLPFGALLAAIGARRIDAIERIPLFRPAARAGSVAALTIGIGYFAFTLASQGRVSQTAVRVVVAGVAAGAVAMLSARVRHGRLILAPLLVAIALQFAQMQRDYHGEYMQRLAPWLQGNIKGVVTRLLTESDRLPQAPIYFPGLRNGLGYWDLKNRWMPDYWRFYAVKGQRGDIVDRAVFLTQDDDVRMIPPGSLLLGNLEDPQLKMLLNEGAERIVDIPELDRQPFFTIIVR